MTKGLPMSYLQVKTVEEGVDWYMQFERYPKEVAEMLARYEWGDLSYTTPKEFRNQKKRAKKKAAKPPPHLVVKRGKFLVHFD
jgi:hypothetical protein